MRQVCNVSYFAQAESLDHENGELQRWQVELETPPRGYALAKRQSFVAPELDALMAPPRAG